MSLINDALKKAQRLRLEQQASARGDAPAGEIRKRARPMRAQLLVLLIAGGTVLVVFSVIITVYLLNRDSNVAPAPAPLAKSAPIVDASAPSPVIVAPTIPAPSSSATPSTATPEPVSAVATPPVSTPPAIVVPETVAPAATPPAPTVTTTSAAAAPAESSASSAAPSAPADAPATIPPAVAAAVEAIAPSPDVRAQQFVDALRVTGIRASGNDSKVLMNDRVFRVNDIVDRNLGLKLIMVAPDSLLFADPTGATYTKIF